MARSTWFSRKISTICSAVAYTLLGWQVSSVSAVLPTAPILLTQNPGFESDGSGSFAGWQQHGSWGVGLTTEVLRIHLSPGRFDELAGEYRLLIRGQGGIGQVVEIPADAENLLMNAMAYFRGIDGASTDNALQPTLQVTYYDAQWQEVDKRTLEVGSYGGSGSHGLNNYTLGLEIPQQAQFALMVIFNFDPSLEVFVDHFALYDATDRTPPGGLKNLVFNTPLAESIEPDSDGNPYFMMGNEFWYTNLRLTDHLAGGLIRWGSLDQDEWAWQPVNVVENRLYQITVKADLINSNTPPEVGLDFYGEQNGRVFLLQRRMFNVLDLTTPNTIPQLSEVFVAPAGTAFSTVHFLAPQITDTPPPNQYTTDGTAPPEIVLLDIGSAPSSATETTAHYTSLTATSSGWSLKLWLRDQDGIDENSMTVIGNNPDVLGSLPDVFFKSLSDPDREYEIFRQRITRQPTVTIQDEGREIGINIFVVADDPSDLGELVIREGAIRDQLGNPNARIEYAPFAAP